MKLPKRTFLFMMYGSKIDVETLDFMPRSKILFGTSTRLHRVLPLVLRAKDDHLAPPHLVINVACG